VFAKGLYAVLVALVAALPAVLAVMKAVPVQTAKGEKPPGLLRFPRFAVLSASSLVTLFVLLNVLASKQVIQNMSMGRVQAYAALLLVLAGFCVFMYMSLYYRVTLLPPRAAQPTPPDSRAGYATRDMALLVLHAVASAAGTLAFYLLIYKLFLLQAVTNT
jgi:hypothetical protein